MGADETNFPFLVDINADTDINTSTVQADLDDIRFYDGSGNLLKHKIDSFTIDGTSCTAQIYVRLLTVYTAPSGTNNTIWMYYGYASATSAQDAANTFSKFSGRWAMNDDPNTSTIQDSCSGNHDGTKSGAGAPSEATGIVGKGQLGDASGEYITLGATEWMTNDVVWTVSVWLKASASKESQGVMNFLANSVQHGLSWGYDYPVIIDGGTGTRPKYGTTKFDYDGTTWDHCQAVKSAASTYAITLNGVSLTIDTYGDAVALVENNLFRSQSDNSNRTFQGVLDEARAIDGVALDASWAKFEYRNVIETDHEQTWAAEEDQPVPALVVQDSACLVESDNVALTQHQVLVVADSECVVASESPALIQHQVLTVADSQCVVESESPALTQHQVLAVADSECVVESGNVVLTQHNILVVADSACLVESGNVVLVQHHVLTVADSECVVTSDNVTLTVQAGSVVLFQQQLLLAV